MIDVLRNLGVGLLVALIEVALLSFFVKRFIARRDAERWTPFRRYLLQALHDNAIQLQSTAHQLFEDLKQRLDTIAPGAADDAADLRQSLADRIDRGTREFSTIRNEVHRAIQTAAPSLSSASAVHFDNMFRSLDNSPALCRQLADSILAPESPAASAAPSDEVRAMINTEAIKVLAGTSFFASSVGSLLDHEGYAVIEGLVSTPEDVRRRLRVEAAFDSMERTSQ